MITQDGKVQGSGQQGGDINMVLFSKLLESSNERMLEAMLPVLLEKIKEIKIRSGGSGGSAGMTEKESEETLKELAQIMSSHTDVEGSNFEQNYYGEWECFKCNRSFSPGAKDAARKHALVHYPLAYRCPDCDQRFQLLSGLVQHAESNHCDAEVRSGGLAKMLHLTYINV